MTRERFMLFKDAAVTFLFLFAHRFFCEVDDFARHSGVLINRPRRSSGSVLGFNLLILAGHGAMIGIGRLRPNVPGCSPVSRNQRVCQLSVPSLLNDSTLKPCERIMLRLFNEVPARKPVNRVRLLRTIQRYRNRATADLSR